MNTTLLKREDLQKLLKVSASTIDNMINDGRLPHPIDLGDRTRRWKSDVVQKWIDDGCPRRDVLADEVTA